MISQHIVDWCHSSESVSSKLAKDPLLSPDKVIKELFEKNGGFEKSKKFGDDDGGMDDLERAFTCGKWGVSRPSDLFLRASLLQIDNSYRISKAVLSRYIMMSCVPLKRTQWPA